MSSLAEAGPARREGPAFCSIIAKNYLAHARALTRSLRRHHPDVPVYVLVVDEPNGCIDPSAEEFLLVRLETLDPPSPRELCFRYELLELCTAVKPLFLRWLFGRGHDRVVFLDPDVWVYRPLHDLLRRLDEWDVVLTPHLTARVDDGKYPDERLMLLVGAYNLGFLALAQGRPVDGLLDWWWARCERECLFERERGYFLDQKWMNLVPGMLDRVLVLRHPGYNVAHWNLNHRRVTGPPSAPLVNGEPLYFLHCSSVDPLDPPRLACPQTRYDRLDHEPLLMMLQDYSAELLAGGYRACFGWPYTYATFDDGHPIDREMRRLFRELPPGRFPDPFRSDGADTFREWAIAAAAPARPVPLRCDHPATRERPAPAEEAPAPRRPDEGATVIGYLRAESGMGELARSTVRALRAVSYPLNVLELRATVHRHADLSVRATEIGERLAHTVVVLTAPDALRERTRMGPPSPASFTIGYWPWELEVFPDDLGDVFGGFDEIWAMSRFSAGAIARASPVPVHTVWPALPDVGLSPEWPPGAFLDPEEYNFLFVYDVVSESETKNPLDLVRAFRQAFRRDDRVRLTIKTSNAEMRSEEWRRVVRAAEGVRITVRDRCMTRRDLLALMRACDCYVSLHRAEGFAFTIVEAMALGKPVIATFYSANTEYMSPWNSFPVPYRMGEFHERRGAYRKGDPWAEPDVEAAAALMRQAYCDRERAREVGLRGQRDVTNQFSLPDCGSRMRRRFEAAHR